METRGASSLHSKQGLSWKQGAFLVIVVPGVILGILELVARGILWSQGAAQAPKPVALEMPTWMLNDANAVARRAPSDDAVDWLKLFREGDGYRVNLFPSVRAEVKNTFSLIPADRTRKYLIATNSIGFRGPELSPTKPSNGFRILVFGDSSSFGWGVNAEDSWSVLLQQKLQEKHPTRTIEVGNFAIPGDSSAYGRLLFETFAPQFQSDLVIFGFGANDAKGVFTSHTEQVSRFSGSRGLLAIRGALRVSAIYRLLESLAERKPSTGIGQSKRPRVPAVTEPEYATNIRAMGQRARELGNKNSLLLALCTPNNYARTARGVARKEGFMWLNGQNQLLRLLPEIEAGQIYPAYVERMSASYPRELADNKLFYITSDGCHPNELGHRFVADRLTQMIEQSGLIN